MFKTRAEDMVEAKTPEEVGVRTQGQGEGRKGEREMIYLILELWVS